jgi:hypothetical protein
VALGADPEPHERRPCRSELAAHARDRLGVHPALVGTVLDRRLLEGREQLVVAVGVGAAPVLVLEARVHDRAHHPDGERGIGAGQRAEVLVRHAGRPAAERVHDHQASAILPGIEQLAPQVGRGR